MYPLHKPATKYNDGMLVVDNQTDFRLLTDSKGAFDIAHGASKCTKQIDIRHHYLQQQVHNRVISLIFAPASLQKAVFFRKHVLRKAFTLSLTNIRFPP